MSTVGNDPKLYVTIPDVTGDGVQDFVFADLTLPGLFTKNQGGKVFVGTPGQLDASKVYPAAKTVPGAAAVSVQAYTYEKKEIALDPETLRNEPQNTSIDGRYVQMSVRDACGDMKRATVFVPEHLIRSAERDGTAINATVTQWGQHVWAE